MTIFAERVKEVRIARGLTCAEVARGICVSTQTYKRIEVGLGGHSIVQYIKLAQFYGVSIDYLLGLKDRFDSSLKD